MLGLRHSPEQKQELRCLQRVSLAEARLSKHGLMLLAQFLKFPVPSRSFAVQLLLRRELLNDLSCECICHGKRCTHTVDSTRDPSHLMRLSEVVGMRLFHCLSRSHHSTQMEGGVVLDEVISWPFEGAADCRV